MENSEAISSRVLPVNSPYWARGLDRVLSVACSVRLGVVLLCFLVLTSIIGMIVMQQNVEGFASYYSSLTPAQKLVYGKLGFFNIYRSWYFSALLCALSLNIVLATIDRLPKVWRYLSEPAIAVPVHWLEGLRHHAKLIANGDENDVVADATEALRSAGFTNATVSAKNGFTYIFAERGAWNRLAFCAVHIALLTIFLGGFLTAQLANSGSITVAPGRSTSQMVDNAFQLDSVTQITKQLPFLVKVTDIQQKLIRPDGSLAAGNTLDWLTWFTISDETGTHQAFVQMNRPFNYRGYRFFQSDFTPIGRARIVTLEVSRIDGSTTESITIGRDGAAFLSDGTEVRLAEFLGNYRQREEVPVEDTSIYQNPVAIVNVKTVNGESTAATAFYPDDPNAPPHGVQAGGYTFRLLDFERVAESHVILVRHDPGANVFYTGFFLLFVTLAAVFLFAHQRLWCVIEKKNGNSFTMLLAAHTNRNPEGLRRRFGKLVNETLRKTRGKDSR